MCDDDATDPTVKVRHRSAYVALVKAHVEALHSLIEPLGVNVCEWPESLILIEGSVTVKDGAVLPVLVDVVEMPPLSVDGPLVVPKLPLNDAPVALSYACECPPSVMP